MLQELQKEELHFSREENVAGFLGVELKSKDDGTIEMRQTGLIDNIIAAMQLEDANSKETPAECVLCKDENGEPFEENFSYQSIIGMLLYLQGHTRPELSFAVSQCARFTFNPKKSHAQALKRIGRYLLGTREEGLILNPKLDHNIDCYVDSDFAGLWNYEDPQDPSSARSRTGYLIQIANCPIHWVSRLQTEIALSTMEAEYVALSTSMKDLIPIIDLVKEIFPAINKTSNEEVNVISTVWEDNNGALTLANLEPPRMTPRSKHYCIKYHWFRTKLLAYKIELKKIASEFQLADIFTKALGKLKFKELRKYFMGW